MPRKSIVCTSCRVSLKRKRNFKESNWCKKCNTWKPKSSPVKCECCGQGLRFKARSTKSKAKRI